MFVRHHDRLGKDVMVDKKLQRILILDKSVKSLSLVYLSVHPNSSGVVSYEQKYCRKNIAWNIIKSNQNRVSLDCHGEKEMATHSSILAWRIPGMEEPGGLPSMGLHRVGHDWSDLAVAADCHE